MFEVGQRVLCIDDHIPPAAAAVGIGYGIRAGGIYTIDGIGKCSVTGEPLLYLFGITPIVIARVRYLPEGRRFRPLDDPALEVFRQMAAREPIAV